MTRAKTRRPCVVTSVLVSLLVVGCAGSSEPSGSAGPTDETHAVEHLAEALGARHEAAAGARPFDSVVDVLPNTHYQRPDGTTEPLTELVVVGRITDVAQGRGFYVEGDDAPGGIETSFEDPRALWRTVHAQVAVESVLPPGPELQSVVVGLAFGSGTPFEVPAEGLPALGDVVLFLQKSPVFAYDPQIYGIVQDGALLADVGAGGELSLPALDDSEEAELLTPASTVEGLRAAAKAPRRVVQLDATGVRVN